MRRLLLLMLTGSLLALSATASPKRVALVFDDGPRSADLEPLLAILAAEKVPVTFSLVGERVVESPALARALLAAGHEIANHSFAHAHPRELDDAALTREVGETQRVIREATGQGPRWYWPPYLETDPRLDATVAKFGLTIYRPHHLVSSQDWDIKTTAAEILRLATTDVRDGTVVLFHEWRLETRQQLPGILAELRRQGCEFFTFSSLHEQRSEVGKP